LSALAAAYPEYSWDPLRFLSSGQGIWKSLDNQRALFATLAQRLGIRTVDDWYNVTTKDILENGGRGLLTHYYGGSLIKGK
jgi:hypothetical protein